MLKLDTTRSGGQSWYDHRNDVKAVAITADEGSFDEVNTTYWFYGYQSIVDNVAPS